MTRKDYRLIAAALQAAHPGRNSFEDARTAWRKCRDCIASALRSDNYRFDRDRFNAACEPTKNSK